MNTIGAAVFLLALQAGRPGGQGGPGEFAGELRDKDGPMMRVHMLAPSRMPPTRSLALLLVYHGMNGNENNYYGGTVEALRRMKMDQEVVVVAGKSKGAGWTIEDDGPITKRVIAWALEAYPIDPRQVYLWGSSNGAAFVGRFGWQNQDLVAGVVAYCGGGFDFSKGEKVEDGDRTTEWYFVHGGADRPEASINGAKQLRAKGIRAVVRVLDGYGHTDIWDGNGHPDKGLVDACRDDYLQWLRALRQKTQEPPAKDKAWLEKFEKPSSAESLLGNKATYLNLQRIGGPPAAAAVLAGLQSKNAGVRAAAAESGERASWGKAAAIELGKLAWDENERVWQAALRTLGTWANWHYPEAIDALCDVVSGKAPDGGKAPSAGKRLLAVDGLGRAAQRAAAGHFEVARLWWTRVGALDDAEARVRAAALAALLPAVKDGFGYAPGAVPDARKGALEKWRDWAGKKCGPPPAAP
jgi:predicted esterase